MAVASSLSWGEIRHQCWCHVQCFPLRSKTQQVDQHVQAAAAGFKSYSQVYVHRTPNRPSLNGWVRPRQRRSYADSLHIFEGVRRLRESFEVLAVVLVGVWQAAVVADGNLGLVGVDEDPGVSVRTAAAITRHNSVVGPADGLLVDELYGRVGLGLEIEVCLLEAGARHGLIPWALTPGPDSLPVWRLGQLCRQLALGLWHGRLCRGRGRHGLRVQLARCGGEGPWRESREPAGRSEASRRQHGGW